MSKLDELTAALAIVRAAGYEVTFQNQVMVGMRVQKVKGYRWPGVVVADFYTLSRQRRIVVECTVPEIAGALHIYNTEQVEEVEACKP